MLFLLDVLKMNNLKLILFIILFLFIACNKEDTENDGDSSRNFEFKYLETEKDTISPGETTEIVATASGYKLTYKWSASLGDLLATAFDSVVIYVSSPCHIGNNLVSCEITDGNNETQTKTITIVVE